MTDSQPQSKRQRIGYNTNVSVESRSSSPSAEPSTRKLWQLAETVLARIEVLERLDREQFTECPRSSDVSSHTNDATPRALYKMLEAALTRISVLERKRDISYLDGFKASHNGGCVVRGCKDRNQRPDNALRHLKDSPSPEHQVAAIILGQTRCLQCSRDYTRPSYLLSHEIRDHNEIYTSRLDGFRQYLGRLSYSASAKASTQTSQSKSNRTSRSTHKPPEALHLSTHSETVPEKSPPPSDFKLNDPSQIPIKHMLPDWSHSMGYDLAITNTPEIPTQLIRTDLQSFSENPTHHTQLESSSNGFQNRTNRADIDLIQPSSSEFFDPRRDWSELFDRSQGSVGFPQTDWSKCNDL